MQVKVKVSGAYAMIRLGFVQATMFLVQHRNSQVGANTVSLRMLSCIWSYGCTWNCLSPIIGSSQMIHSHSTWRSLKNPYSILWGCQGDGQGNVVHALIDSSLIDVQSFFKMSMKSNCVWAMGNFEDLNPIAMIWRKLAINALLASKLSKFYKLANMVVVQNMGKFMDEIVVSTLSMTKMKLRNKLTDQLDLTVRMFCQKHWRLDNFHLTMPLLHANKWRIGTPCLHEAILIAHLSWLCMAILIALIVVGWILFVYALMIIVIALMCLPNSN